MQKSIPSVIEENREDVNKYEHMRARPTRTLAHVHAHRDKHVKISFKCLKNIYISHRLSVGVIDVVIDATVKNDLHGSSTYSCSTCNLAGVNNLHWGKKKVRL